MTNPIKKKEIIGGSILSYILIFLNSIYGLILMPYIISKIGDVEYGVYQSIASMTSAFMVLDLGLGNTTMRYIARFIADNQLNKIGNYITMNLIQASFLAILASLISIGIYHSLDTIYCKGFTPWQIEQAHNLFKILSISIVLHLFENVLGGIVMGYNKFVFYNSLKAFRIILRILLTILLIGFYKNSIVLVSIDLSLICFLIIIELTYIFLKLKIRIEYDNLDITLFKDSLKYTVLMFICSFMGQANSNIPNVVIGALQSASAVTIYAIAIQLYAIYTQCSSAISGVMLPSVIQTLKNDDKNLSKTKELVIRVGRVQFLILAGILVCFIIIGKDFIDLWIGDEKYKDSYYIALIMFIPAIFELCINVCISILRAMFKLKYYTNTILISIFINISITIIGTYFVNYYFASIGMAIGIIFLVISMNRYYNKELHFNMNYIYKKIFSRIWLCLFLSGVLSWLTSFWISSSTLTCIVGGFVFIISYLVTLTKFKVIELHEKKIQINI